MRVEYINPFVEAAFNILKEVTNADIKRGDLYLKPSSMSIQGVAALVGLAGDVEGRVLFDMDKDSALMIVSCMNGEPFTAMDEMAKATIQELANMITAQAVTKLHDLGFKFDLTPPALFTGDNMEVSSNMGKEVEALIVPMNIALDKKKGKIEINVVIRERM
jgi:chemotaxis protein CheX